MANYMKKTVQKKNDSAFDKQEGGNHYKNLPIQPIQAIVKNNLDWFQGNITKYAWRHHFKGGAEDLKKVIHYAELALEEQYGIKPEVKNVAKPITVKKKVTVKNNRLQNTKNRPTTFMMKLIPSKELAAVIGAEPVSRTDVVKKMWAYIRANNLQDPRNKRQIKADEKMKAVFGKDTVSMFELASLIGKHLK
jgi:upstream activation factor subunit UAF30